MFSRFLHAVLCSALLAGLSSCSGTYFSRIDLLPGPENISCRGLHVCGEGTVWVTGNKGYLFRKTSAEKNFRKINAPGQDSLDFRDVFAVDSNQVWIMSAGDGRKSRIYRSSDGGKNWQTQFVMPHSKGFLDAIEFGSNGFGMALGDPVNGNFFLLRTTDGGTSWQEIPGPTASPGVAAFAASGSCLEIVGDRHVWIATGGAEALVLRSTDAGITWQESGTPLPAGAESMGVFSISMRDELHGMISGGDYLGAVSEDESKEPHSIAITSDGGLTWTAVNTASGPYYSSVEVHPASPYTLFCGGKSLGIMNSKMRAEEFPEFGIVAMHVVAPTSNAHEFLVSQGEFLITMDAKVLYKMLKRPGGPPQPPVMNLESR